MLIGPKAISCSTVGAIIWSSGFWKTIPTVCRTLVIVLFEIL